MNNANKWDNKIDIEQPEKSIDSGFDKSDSIQDIPTSDTNLFENNVEEPLPKIPGMNFVQSMPYYCTNINKPVEYVINRAVQQLCISWSQNQKFSSFE